MNNKKWLLLIVVLALIVGAIFIVVGRRDVKEVEVFTKADLDLIFEKAGILKAPVDASWGVLRGEKDNGFIMDVVKLSPIYFEGADREDNVAKWIELAKKYPDKLPIIYTAATMGEIFEFKEYGQIDVLIGSPFYSNYHCCNVVFVNGETNFVRPESQSEGGNLLGKRDNSFIVTYEVPGEAHAFPKDYNKVYFIDFDSNGKYLGDKDLGFCAIDTATSTQYKKCSDIKKDLYFVP